MKKLTLALLIGSLFATITPSFAAAPSFDVDGATVGKWTMDLDAAKKLAAEKSLPILLDFSGSDWCGWCKLMEENVFETEAWKAYAAENLVMVLIDFPNDKSLVPEKYVARNKALQAQFAIEGFPTFIVLDDDGTTLLGRLTAGQNKTPESFQAELKILFKKRAHVQEQYIKSLSPEAQKEFKALTAQIAQLKADGQKEVDLIEAATARAEKIMTLIQTTEEKLQDFRISQLDEEQQQKYKALEAEFTAKESKFEAWLGTEPERSEENIAFFEKMQAELTQLQSQLSEF